MGSFLDKLRRSADTMNFIERQKALQLVVREVLIDDENNRVMSSIPLARSNMPIGPMSDTTMPGYSLHKGRHIPGTQ